MSLAKKRISGKYWPGCPTSTVQGGAEYFEVLEKMIDSAEESIYLHVYIFAPDKTGEKITDALVRASARGVLVHLLVDSFGSPDLSTQWQNKIKNAGVHFRFFMPIFSRWPFHFGRRMHHKVALVDGKKALVGGINIADKYRGTENVPAWLDFAVLVEGPVCAEIENICEAVWNQSGSIPRIKRGLRVKPASPYDQMLVAVRDNDWARGRNAISLSYKRSMQGAQKSILIIASYFLPGRRVRHILKKAAKRGVKVRIILGGISDVGLFRLASRHLYEGLMKNGAEIYEYQKSVVHAKVAVIDGVWSTIGSYNLNYISDFNDLELNIDISGREFAQNFTGMIEKNVLSESVMVAGPEYFQKNSFWVRAKNYTAYQIMRLIMKMLNIFTPSNSRYERE